MRYIIKECFNFKNISSIREIITMYNLLNNKIECVYIDNIRTLFESIKFICDNVFYVYGRFMCVYRYIYIYPALFLFEKSK
jgi:hypothetical protein